VILQTGAAQRQFLLDWPAALPDRHDADLARIAQLSCRRQGLALMHTIQTGIFGRHGQER
jgi:hypothetical protein